jgi:hypothetical protein
VIEKLPLKSGKLGFPIGRTAEKSASSQKMTKEIGGRPSGAGCEKGPLTVAFVPCE